ncbi:DEAD/DEAH box helicase [Clostridium sp. 'White wine YQ']|uniref:DEAD/DEAH box helicase n=1 Tax=Clostridium sp. 'White wine YQ' TaxID=3027474 RepID=UPI0023672F5E|nr:DEAD/DEAH box helicase [Clostridium sp. 'White wine YQ']MDD7794356.1 DEAD/DEAH box helicase [Clostridium sp. 'White wine YQ']
MIIKIDICENEFILSGDIEALLKNRRYKLFFKNYFEYEVDDKIIKVFFQKENKEVVLNKLRSFFRKNDIEEQLTDNINDILEEYFIEDNNFENFSKKALNIRNNVCNTNEFSKFTSVLREKLPHRTLYPLQLLSAFHLAFSQNSCNFSVPGAGKTSIVYGAFGYLSSLDKDDIKKVDKIVIVGPLSSFGPWESEFFECFGSKPSVKRLSGMSKEKRREYLISDNIADITLISYQGVYSIIKELSFLLRENKVMLVLDEAHKIKNTDGGIAAKAILEIAQYAKSRVILTGTPAPNGYEDLYNLFRFIWPNKDIIKFKVNQLREMSNNKYDVRIKNLIKNLEPYFIRIRKSDLGLPEVASIPPIEIEMGEKQREIYRYIEKKYMDYLIEKDLESSALKEYLTRARVIRLMQAATNPNLLKQPIEKYILEETSGGEIYFDDSEIMNKVLKYTDSEIPSKYTYALKIINRKIQKGEKVIVWSIYVNNIKEFSKFLLDNNIKNKLLYGETPVDGNYDGEDIETREKIVKEFHEKDSLFNVIIANPFAVAESISLHKVCHTAIYLDRSFNAAQFLQSKDRIHRYGLDASIRTEYYYLISKDSIEETIDRRLEEKEERLMKIIESSSIPLFDNVGDDIGNDDIKALIRDYVRRTKDL